MRYVDLLSLISVLGLVACGGSSDGGTSGGGTSGGNAGTSGPPAGPVTEAQFREQVPALFCQSLQTCCEAAGVPYNPLTCQLFSTPAAPDPSLTYDAAAAGSCLQLLQQNQTCEGSDMPSTCNRVYSGNKQPGAACTDDAECAVPADGDAECDLFDSVCIVVRRGAMGDACTSSCTMIGTSGYSCSHFENSTLSPNERVDCYREDGLTCLDEVCTPLAENGGACITTDECVEGSYCPYNVEDRTCLTKLAVGAACTQFGDECADTAYCDANALCATRKANGETCSTVSNECQGGCINGVCGAATDLGTGLLALFCGGELTVQ